MVEDVDMQMLATMLATAAAVLLAMWLLGKSPQLPGNLSSKGSVVLDSTAFAAHDEARRDLGRSFCAHGIYVSSPDNTVPTLLKPSESPPIGVDKEALEAQFKAFCTCLKSLSSRTHSLSPSELERVASYLTVSPTVSLLLAVGAPPMLTQSRFVIHFGNSSSIHVYSIGYVGTPGSSQRSVSKQTQYVLSVVSPDLRDDLASASIGNTVTYSVQKAKCTKIEDELKTVFQP